MAENGPPEGWVGSPLGSVIELKYGKGLPKARRRGDPVAVYGSNGVVGHHDKALTNGPTIIVGRKGSVGAVHRSPSGCWPIDTTYFVDDFSCFEPTYLEHLLRSLDLSELETSTAIPGLNRDDAYASEIAIPPLAEQKRIVAMVEKLLARVNAGRERLANVPAILKRFRQSVLAAACSGRLTAGWRDAHPDIEPASELLREVMGDRQRSWRKEKYRDPITPELPDGVELADEWRWASLEGLASQVVDCYERRLKIAAPGGLPKVG